jgi:predicted acylesterase/phospholipase RssA
MIRDNPDVQRAEDILRGKQAEPKEVRELAELMKKEKQFGYARKLLFTASQDPSINNDPELAKEIRRQRALCTYKDPDLLADTKFIQAIEILGQSEDLNHTTDQETLGIAGAIYKNKWEAFAQRADLERSLAYYLRGAAEPIEHDFGYTRINAAFVLDVLADQEKTEAARANTVSPSAQGRTDRAREIRQEIATKLPPMADDPKYAKNGKTLRQKWWFCVTVAEAMFGINDLKGARKWLEDAKNVPGGAAHWEFETTARQLASLARLKGIKFQPGEEAWDVLNFFLDGAPGVTSAYVGKVGLGLSGGGFRAALFHIGVLAKLAELDVLRHVEALSCVSGGSIVGAQYYLELQKVLQEKNDADITRQDYVNILQKVQKDFLAGVQKNIRTRVLANPWANIRMLLFPNASRTERVGELYEKHLFRRAVAPKAGDDDMWIGDLLVKPQGGPDDFNPKTHNWLRRAKVPTLILNATTLNTGHNWQFTASWMGEPPAGIDNEIDSNYRLRRMYYYEAPKEYRHYRLGYAVAASSCVPGLFEPINLPDLFPYRTVRLVDGGVCDNQGVVALLDQSCSVLLVSDASGQMEAQNQPGNSALSSLLRSNSILQTRVREAEYHELDARRRSCLLRGMMFIHLKKDLDVDPVDWTNCEDPFDASEEARPSIRRGDLTTYGIRKDVQGLLAAIRTDLDSFNEVEAYALMTSGYRMTEYEFPRSVPNFPASKEPPVTWEFLKIEAPMKRVAGVDAAHHEIMELLKVANYQAFKIWRLVSGLRILGWFLLAGLVVVAGWACYRWSDFPLLTPGRIGITALVAAGTVLLGGRLMRLMRYKDTAERVGISVGMGVVGWLLASIHIFVFDQLYLHRGRLSRIDAIQKKDQPADETEST